MEQKFVKTKEATKILGIHYQTLHKFCKSGKIEYIKQKNGYRLYNITKYIKDNIGKEYLNKIIINKIKRKICYCRVSSLGQKSDLENQIKYMKELYPTHELITDIGSGINFKRKGLLKKRSSTSALTKTILT